MLNPITMTALPAIRMLSDLTAVLVRETGLENHSQGQPTAI